MSPPHLRYHLCVHSFFLPLFLSFLSSIDRHGVNLQNATNKQVPSHVESWCIASGDLNRFIFGDAGCSIWWGWFAFLGGREMENPFNVFLPRTSASTNSNFLHMDREKVCSQSSEWHLTPSMMRSHSYECDSSCPSFAEREFGSVCEVYSLWMILPIYARTHISARVQNNCFHLSFISNCQLLLTNNPLYCSRPLNRDGNKHIHTIENGIRNTFFSKERKNKTTFHVDREREEEEIEWLSQKLR